MSPGAGEGASGLEKPQGVAGAWVEVHGDGWGVFGGGGGLTVFPEIAPMDSWRAHAGPQHPSIRGGERPGLGGAGGTYKQLNSQPSLSWGGIPMTTSQPANRSPGMHEQMKGSILVSWGKGGEAGG